MIAIKLARTDISDVSELQRQFGNAVRFCFNRYVDTDGNIMPAQASRLAQAMNHVEMLDATTLQMASRKAYSIYKAFKKNDSDSLIFGGKSNWRRYQKHLISKEEFNANRQLPIYIEGDKNSRGNRKFSLDLNHDRIIFKPSKNEHYDITFKSKGNARRAWLAELQRRYDAREELCFTVELSKDFITLIIDEKDFAKDVPHINGRTASIDMNPNYIALVIRDEKGQFLIQEIFDLKRLSELDKRKNYSKKEDKKKWRSYLNSKRKHEVLQVAKRIASQCVHYQVSDFVIEDLNIKSRNFNKGKAFNKLCLNSWMRKSLANNLRKRMNLMKIGFHEVYAGYSSIKGQLEHDEKVDSIAAAIEIGDRINKNLRKFGDSKVELGNLSNRWKKEIGSNFKQVPSWKQVYEFLKKNYPKNSYRVLFSEQHPLLRASFRMSSKKSFVKIHSFDDRILHRGEKTSTEKFPVGDSSVEVKGLKFI